MELCSECHGVIEVEDMRCHSCQMAVAQAEVERLKGMNAMWIGIKEDREERIRERDEARAIVRVYWTLHDRFSMSPEELKEHLTQHPWLEED